MKTFKLIGMALLAIVMSVNFTSCSSDDDPEPEDNPTETKGKKVVSVDTSDEGINIFSYGKDGKLSKVRVKDRDYSTEYTYIWQDNIILISETYNGETEEYGIVSLSNNRMTTFADKEQKVTLTYDKEGRLSQVHDEYYDSVISSNTDIIYLWKGGNLIQSIRRRVDSDGTESNMESNFKYDTKKEANNICYLYEEYITDRIFPSDVVSFLLIANPELIGTGNKNAISRIETKEDQYSHGFSYEYNADEYPTLIVEKEDDPLEEPTTFKITWE